MTARVRSATRLPPGGLLSAPETSGELESWGAPGPGQVHHRVRKRRTHLYVRGRDPVRHRRAQRRVRVALAGRADRQLGLRGTPLAGPVDDPRSPMGPASLIALAAAGPRRRICQQRQYRPGRDLAAVDRRRLGGAGGAVVLRLPRQSRGKRDEGPLGLGDRGGSRLGAGRASGASVVARRSKSESVSARRVELR